MKQTVTESMFRDAFNAIRPDNFSYEGLGHLYEYFMEYEESTGEELELDVIAICCDFNEEPIKDVLENYAVQDVEELSENTLVLWHDDETVIYQVY